MILNSRPIPFRARWGAGHGWFRPDLSPSRTRAVPGVFREPDGYRHAPDSVIGRFQHTECPYYGRRWTADGVCLLTETVHGVHRLSQGYRGKDSTPWTRKGRVPGALSDDGRFGRFGGRRSPPSRGCSLDAGGIQPGKTFARIGAGHGGEVLEPVPMFAQSGDHQPPVRRSGDQ